MDATGLDARHASTHYRYGYTPAYCAAYDRGWVATCAWKMEHPEEFGDATAKDLVLLLGAVGTRVGRFHAEARAQVADALERLAGELRAVVDTGH